MLLEKRIIMPKEDASKKKEKSKERILKSAAYLFAKKGYDNVGIREICKRANANLCMIPHYWGTKLALYQAVVDNFIQKQTQYAKTFMSFETEPKDLSKKEQIELLYKILFKIIDFTYSKEISAIFVKFLISEHHEKRAKINSPLLNYIRNLIAVIFNKDVNDNDIIYKNLFIISQINAPKVMPRFSLELLNKKEFEDSDKEIIKANLKIYIQALLMQEGINV